MSVAKAKWPLCPGMVSILTMEEFRNVFQLWNIVLSIATVIDEQWEHVIVLFACVRLIQFGQIIEDDAPSLGLFRGVVDARQALAVLIIECNVCKIFSAEIIFAEPRIRIVRVRWAIISIELRQLTSVRDTFGR